MSKHLRSILIACVVLIVALLLFDRFLVQGPVPDHLSYTDFYRRVTANQVARVTIYGHEIEGEFAHGGHHFELSIPDGDSSLLDTLRKHNVDVNVDQQGGASLFSWLLQALVPPVVMGLLLLFFLRQAQAGGSQAMMFGRSRAKMLSENRPKVTFADVAGIEEAKQELSEVVEFLKYPKKFQLLGARIPKGVLLLGPPGSGKTLLARAVAGEAGVPFFSISGSDFVELYVGVGASRVRDLFEQAKRSAPCIIFIDEIDAVGRQRGAGLGGGHDEREQTLNQLLVEMDGFEPNTGVILVAATNRPDVLDPALLRPGRFDRQIVVDSPDVRGRERILAIHSANKPLAPAVSLEILARRTPGFSGADLENLLNEAALLAARQGKETIDMHTCEAAIDRVIAGPERRSRIISPREREIVAYHESGHAIVGGMLEHASPVHKVTIVSRGMALGLTMQLPVEDRYLMSRVELLHQIIGLLGGRAAEEIQFSEVTTGASNDFEKATELARRMVTEYGMSSALGPIRYGRGQHAVFLGRDLSEDRNYSEEVARRIDEEVAQIINSCYTRARELLQEHWSKVERLVGRLQEAETVDADEVLAILGDRPFVPPLSDDATAPALPTGESSTQDPA